MNKKRKTLFVLAAVVFALGLLAVSVSAEVDRLWVKDEIADVDASALAYNAADELTGAFTAFGVWHFNGSAWAKMVDNDAVALAYDSADNLAGAFPGWGIWVYDGADWGMEPLVANDANALAYSADGELTANFPGWGVYSYDGEWALVTGTEADALAYNAAGNLVGSFPGVGVYELVDDAWVELSDVAASAMAAGTNLAGSFPGYGVYVYDGTDWGELDTNDATALAYNSNDDLAGAFGPFGIWYYLEVDDDLSAYLKAADVQYAYDSGMLIYDVVNSELGGRTSGSDAEHEAAEMLYQEMISIGLQDVSKDAFPVVRWQFNDATLTIEDPEEETRIIKPYSYASGGTDPEGITAELIYLGKGTMYDYEGVDVEGKIVLIDIDMYWDWWVTYPTLEAALQGAAAIINSTSGGYGMFNDDTMNCQDFVGPVTIPSLNISRNDANYLKGLLEEGPVTINLVVDNEVEEGGTGYNVIGSIPGTRTDELIIIGSHYDVHFWGFQDNLMAVGLTLGIAKAMIDSGYEPERTIVFVVHAAEEYGAINTRYDWSIGAWNQIFTVRPEWAGKALTYINFELPAYEFESSTYVASTPELYSFLKDFIATAPQPVGAFPDGIRDEGQMQTSWADNFSYNIAGVPALHNGFHVDADGNTYPLYENIYHSNFDLPDTYNEAVHDFNLRFYGALAMAFDRTPALELDFRHQADWIEDVIDVEAFAIAGIDPQDLLDETSAFRNVAGQVHDHIKGVNADYWDMLEQGNVDESQIAELWQDAEELNQDYLAAFKAFQDELLRLDWWDSPMIGHEQPQENVLLLTEAIALLEEGDVATVIDELLWLIDGTRVWYSYSFSREVTDYFVWQVFDPANQDNLFWGDGRIVGYVDLYDVVQSLMAKYEDEDPDLEAEIADLEIALQSQIDLLVELVDEEVESLIIVRTMLEDIIN